MSSATFTGWWRWRLGRKFLKRPISPLFSLEVNSITTNCVLIFFNWKGFQSIKVGKHYLQNLCRYLLSKVNFWGCEAVTARWRSDAACRVCPLSAPHLFPSRMFSKELNEIFNLRNILFNVSHPDYKNTRKKDEYWDYIARSLEYWKFRICYQSSYRW